MDAKDLKILALLQENATITVAEISSKVHLSQTPVWRRIQKMEADGIIERRVALVNPAAVGFTLSVFVEIQAPDHSREWLGQFIEVVSALPEVMEVHRMAGEVDYLLRVAVKSMEDYDAFYQRLVEQVSARNITSRFSMERLKATTAFPLVPSKPATGARL